MKPNIIFISAIAGIFIYSTVSAQNIFPSNGRTGIYTTSPAASLQVRGGARIGTTTNYTNIDSATGNLSFVGNAAYKVAGNKYAFQYSGNSNYGLFFNSTNVQYEFRNGSAVPVFYINANSGNGVFTGNLKIGAYTLPATDGTNGQVLKTNGSGVLTWSNDNGGGGSGWSLTGNAGTNSLTNFIGTTDAQSLAFRVNNQKSGWVDYTGNNNTSFGYQGLLANTTGFYNTAIGYNTLKANIIGGRNTAIGAYTLVVNNADNNTAVGTYALSANISGINNTATGVNALQANTSGNANAAYGVNALYANTTGIENTASGYGALFQNLTGNDNAAFGKYALYNNNADNNTALGFNSLFFNSSGTSNTATGSLALQNNTIGQQNTANGFAALTSNSTGNYNTAIGSAALNNNTADNNTATGAYALYLNTSGTNNTANGYAALNANSTGNYNTASGANALHNNTTGNSNISVGYLSAFNNQTGNSNTSVGVSTLEKNIEGIENTALGYNSLRAYNGILYDFILGKASYNTAIGAHAMEGNTNSVYNYIGASTAVGSYALYNVAGDNDDFQNVAFANTAIGFEAMYLTNTGYSNTALGNDALFSNIEGVNNTAVGAYSDVSDANLKYTTAIGSGALTTASYQIRIGSIGNSYNDPTSIGGKVGWSTLSDGRVKKNIKENVPGLQFINKLKPITYNLDNDVINEIVKRPVIKDKSAKEIKPSANELAASKANAKIIYTGFVAQDVEKAAKSLNYDLSGVDAAKNDKDLYGLRYSDFVVPLVKAVQELSAKNDDLQKQIDDLKAMIIAGNQNSGTFILSDASLEQNVPNPFSHTTTINYSLPQKFSNAQVIITDKNGKKLKTINISGSGKSSVNVDAATLSSGAYQYTLLIDGKQVATKQMMLIK